MTWLLLDTACPRAVVAVARDGKILAERFLTETTQHSAHLNDAIVACLDEAQLGFADVTNLGVGVGPGSFVGVRIALAHAKGLSVSLGLPQQGISTLLALWRSVFLNEPLGMCAIDARREAYYVVSKDRHDPYLLDRKEFEAKTAGHSNLVVCEQGKLLGPTGLGLYRALIEHPVPPVPVYVRMPDAVVSTKRL